MLFGKFRLRTVINSLDLIQIKSLHKFRSLPTLLEDVNEMRNTLTAEFVGNHNLGRFTLTRGVKATQPSNTSSTRKLTMKSHEDGHVSSSGFIGRNTCLNTSIHQSKLGKQVESSSTVQTDLNYQF